MNRRGVKRSRMDLSAVATVAGKELRETLRDRRTLAVMILFPLVVYPLLSLLLAGVIGDREAAEEARVSRVAVAADPGVPDGDAAPIRALLGSPGSHLTLVSPALASGADVGAGRVDVAVEVGGARAGEPRTVRVSYDETRDSSDKAQARVTALLNAALPVGCVRSFAVAPRNIAPKSKVGGYVLSKILPLIVVVMTMLGAFYPAIDITAGERERGTLETLLSSPVRRFDLMTGKVLAVAALATLTGILNIASMSLTVAEGARLAAGGQSLTIPWTRAAATVLTVVPAAFLFAAVMVAVGAMARGFKEAQTLLTPVYLLSFTPALVASVADFDLAGPVLLVPGANLTLLARDLMLGQASAVHAVVVLASTVAVGALALSFAAHLYDSERLLSASDAHVLGLGAWIRHLISGGRGGAAVSPDTAADPGVVGAPAPAPPAAAAADLATPGTALLLFAVAYVLSFFVFPWVQKWRLIPGLLAAQWGGFLGLVWVYARAVRRPLAAVAGLRRPRARALLGAIALGLSGWLILGVLADRLMPPPRRLIEEMRRLIHPPGEGRSIGVSLLALAVTPAFCEEALFRGPILHGLRRRLSAPAACLATGALFGVMHGDLWRFVPTALLGTLLSWVALASASVVPAMVIHFLNNAALTVLGYYGWDEAAEKLSSTMSTGILAAATVLFLLGLVAVRPRRRDSA